MALRGSVKAFSLEEMLEFLTASGHGGTLKVFHKDARKILFLQQGGLWLERSNWSFRLGDALVRGGEITADQLEEALARQKETEERLGESLVALGHTTSEKILAARRYQVEEEVYEAFAWEDAFFEFEDEAFPPDFAARSADPEEFRFDARSVLVEATRRRDEWQNIQERLPSEKRLYVLDEEREGSRKRATRELVESHGRVTDPDEVFDGRRTLDELPRLLGLSRFESLSILSRLIGSGDVRPLSRQELEGRFKKAVKEDIAYALRLFEHALESPEFEARGRFLDRVLFGSASFKEAAEAGELGFTARLKGKRAFELLLALFRQGVACTIVAREEGRDLRLGLSKSSLSWQIEAGKSPPSIVKQLLARSPVSASDLVRVREMQEQTGRTLQQVLVGGGFVSMDNWFRAQKDTVLQEVFAIYCLRRPYLEVRAGEDRPAEDPGLRIDVPLVPWLHTEVMREIREWEAILGLIPSVRAYLVVTPKGEKAAKGADDPLLLFDGERSVEDALKQQPLPPQAFLSAVYAALQSGHLQQLDAESYAARLEAALEAGKRHEAINCCLAAIESNIDAPRFKRRLKELRAGESEITEAARATLRGDLASFSLPEVLQTFHLGKRSGTMRVETREGDQRLARQIYFESGDIYLLSGDMEEELSEQDLEAGLMAAGLITEDQLADAAALQMKDEIHEMFIWEAAEFEFSANYLPAEFYASRAHRKIKLNTVKFLLEAVRRIAEWEAIRETIASDDLVLAFDNSAVKMAAVQDKGHEDLLLLVDGRHAIADLVRMSRMRRFKALALLAELVDEGSLKVVDLEQIEEEDADALFATDLPTSGVIEEGFVGQIQFVGTLQDLAMASLTGVMRVTDGRRSKELALVEGAIHRTLPWVSTNNVGDEAVAEVASPEAARLLELEALDMSTLPDDERTRREMEMKMLRVAIQMEADEAAQKVVDARSPEAERLAELEALDLATLPEEERPRKELELRMLRAAVEMEEEAREKEARERQTKQAAIDTAQDFAECFSWRGTRFELLKGTLPPRLQDPGERQKLALDPEAFFDVLAEAGERWVKVGELIPKDLWVAYTDEGNVDLARERAGDHPELADLVGQGHTAEDIARVSGARFHAMSWLAELFEEGLIAAVDPEPAGGEGEEDWDFSL